MALQLLFHGIFLDEEFFVAKYLVVIVAMDGLDFGMHGHTSERERSNQNPEEGVIR